MISFNLDLLIDKPDKDSVMRIKLYYVYILTNANNRVLYTGVTNDLDRRCYEHKHLSYRGISSSISDYVIYFKPSKNETNNL